MHQRTKNIRSPLATFLAHFFFAFGFIRRAKSTAFLARNITGIAFHNPSQNLFSKSIEWLKRNHYVFISSQDLLDIIKNKSKPPRGGVWVTIDDGWKDNMHNVLPVVIQNNIPVTFFITTDPIENSGHFWWTLAARYRDTLLEVYQIQKKDLFRLNETRRKEIIFDLQGRLPVNHEREAMSIADVKHIANIPQISIGSHTVHHAILPNCTPRELESEIMQSKIKLEHWTGKEVTLFAYPNGAFDGRERSILQESDFRMAATLENRFATAKDDPYLMPRFAAIDSGSLMENICHMVGIWSPVVTKIKKNIAKLFPKTFT